MSYVPPDPRQPASYPQAGFLSYQSVNVRSADDQHLSLLSIFHYVLGGLTTLFSCSFIFHIVMGVMITRGTFNAMAGTSQPVNPIPANFGWIFVAMGIVGLAIGWTMAVLMIISGRFIQTRRHRIFSISTAAFSCLQIPFGTVLGVFTIIVLARDSVKAQYEARLR